MTLTLAGCSTIALQSQYWRGEEPDWPLYVYGGTTFDLVVVAKSVTAGNEASIGGLLIFDVPFSLAADTILLPLCIYEQIEQAQRRPPGSAEPGD